MLRQSLIWTGLALGVMAGCSQSEPASHSTTPNVATAPGPDGGEHTAPTELSDEDKAIVAKQEICPVGGEKLGSMGTPVKVTVKDRTVFLCCKGCQEAIERDPDTYLAKLDAHASAGAPDSPPEDAPATETPAAPPAGDSAKTE